jgi:hypothetical protein
MPTTAEERQVAEDALHLADKEMDLVFATAVRETEQHPPALSVGRSCIKPRWICWGQRMRLTSALRLRQERLSDSVSQRGNCGMDSPYLMSRDGLVRRACDCPDCGQCQPSLPRSKPDLCNRWEHQLRRSATPCRSVPTLEDFRIGRRWVERNQLRHQRFPSFPLSAPLGRPQTLRVPNRVDPSARAVQTDSF